MKRDMELVRRILLLVADRPADEYGQAIEIDGVQSAVLAEHLELLADAGLLVVRPQRMASSVVVCHVDRLTWVGHEFIDAAREESTWQQVRTVLKEKGVALTFEGAKEVLAWLLKRALPLA